MNRPAPASSLRKPEPQKSQEASWKLTLLCKRNCPLCDEAKQAIEAYSSECDLSLQLVDITQDPELWEQYQYEIPVLMINGEEAARHHIGVKKLRVLRRRWQEGGSFPRPRSGVFPAN